MRAAYEMLGAMTRAFPPDEGTRHNLTVQGEKLCLTMSSGGKWHSFLLDDKDMELSSDDLVLEIVALLKRAGG